MILVYSSAFSFPGFSRPTSNTDLTALQRYTKFAKNLSVNRVGRAKRECDIYTPQLLLKKCNFCLRHFLNFWGPVTATPVFWMYGAMKHLISSSFFRPRRLPLGMCSISPRNSGFAFSSSLGSCQIRTMKE